MRLILSACLLVVFLCAPAEAALVITGVIDGDLSGGNPKAIVLTATADIADLSVWGAGSANNGGGTDGVELQFSGSALSGQTIIVTNTAGDAFFSDNFVDNFIIFTGGSGGGPASINGDDAVELFNNVASDGVGGLTGDVFDTYGVVDTIGDGESWDYTDGYAVRTGGVAGAFNQANYTSVFQGLDGQGEPGHIATIGSTFGFTAVPEPSSLAFLGLACVGGLLRRRK